MVLYVVMCMVGVAGLTHKVHTVRTLNSGKHNTDIRWRHDTYQNVHFHYTYHSVTQVTNDARQQSSLTDVHGETLRCGSRRLEHGGGDHRVLFLCPRSRLLRPGITCATD